MPKLTHCLILFLFSFVIFFPGISSIPVIDRDEAHFAQASKQMLQTSNYFQIRFQEKTRFQKPPGINWLQAASVKLFSNKDANLIWPYRLPSALAGFFSIFLLYFFSKRFLNGEVALKASLFLATSLLLVFESHMAVIDSTLLLSVILMQGALWIIYVEDKSHWGWALCFWLSLSFGAVLKGVTPLIAILSILTLVVINKDRSFLKRLHPLKGLLLFIGLTLLWVWQVNAAENSNYLMQMFHKDLLPKLQGGHESHGKPPLFHLAILPLTFWPASLFLWQAASYSFSNRKQKTIGFLLAWLIPTWVFFEIMPTKLPQYVLPTFPALAVLMSLGLDKLKLKPGKWLHLLQSLWLLLSFGLALVITGLYYFLMKTVSIDIILLLMTVFVLSVLSFCFAWKGKYSKAILSVLLLAVLSYPLIFSRILPQLTPIWLSKNLVEKLNQGQISEENPLLAIGYDEPSLVFSLNTKLVKFTNLNEALFKPNMLLIPQKAYLALPDDYQKRYQLESQISGFNYSKGKWLNLLLLKQNEGEN